MSRSLQFLLCVFTLAGVAAPSASAAEPTARLGQPVSALPETRSPTPKLSPIVRTVSPAAEEWRASTKASESPRISDAHPAADEPIPFTFSTALQLAILSNLDVQQSRAVMDQARAALQRARVAWIPNFNLGSTYSHHEGNIQKTEGNIIKANRDSLFVGGGPSVNVQLNEAIFGPLVARQLERASEAAIQRVGNDTLLAVADAYLNILRARRRLARIDDTLSNLTSDQPTPLRAGSKGLLPLVKDFVEVGRKDTLKSDLARVDVEVLRRLEERRGALQEFAVAQAELARLLHLDPRTPLWPAEDFRVPMAIPALEWVGRPVEELVAFSLQNRPELAENQSLVQAAVERVRIARFRPLMPNLNLGYNWGDFGGGPAPNPLVVLPPSTANGRPRTAVQPGFGPSGRINSFGTRTDLDVALYWRLQNFGLGNLAEIREQQAAERQAILRLVQAQDRVATQVVQTAEQINGWRQRLDITRSALFDDEGKPGGPVFRSVQLNFDRIRGAEGRPLEVLDSIRSLNEALESYGQAVTEFERSQFRLLIAVGVPFRTILSSLPPVPAAPLAPEPKERP